MCFFLSDLTSSNSSNTQSRHCGSGLQTPWPRAAGEAVKSSRNASLHLRSRQSVSARLGTPHGASRAPPASPLAAATHPRTFPSPTFVHTCGDQGRQAAQRLGKLPRRGLVRPLAPRRGPNARAPCSQGGGAPGAGGVAEGGSANASEHTREPRTRGAPPGGSGDGVRARGTCRPGRGGSPLAERTAERDAATATEPGGRRGAPGRSLPWAGT